jgi:hypothetical protein
LGPAVGDGIEVGFTASAVGGLNESIVIYETPEYRKPQADEVVEYGGRLWRILNPHLINQEPKEEFTEIHDAL